MLEEVPDQLVEALQRYDRTAPRNM